MYVSEQLLAKPTLVFFEVAFQNCVWLDPHMTTRTHTIYAHMYTRRHIHVCVCACVLVCVRVRVREEFITRQPPKEENDGRVSKIPRLQRRVLALLGVCEPT